MLVNVSIWRWRLLVADAASVTRFVYRCCIIAQFQLRLRSVATFLRGMDFDVAKLDCWYVDLQQNATSHTHVLKWRENKDDFKTVNSTDVNQFEFEHCRSMPQQLIVIDSFLIWS